ncbi:hypothetical protein TNCV_5139901 [Trichonephila clavipes]|nr:hypothetical protein TNCV_5139901 [Trichonephila clavipes]
MPLDNKCRIGPLAGAPPDTCAVVISTETESRDSSLKMTRLQSVTLQVARGRQKIQSTLPMMWGHLSGRRLLKPTSVSRLPMVSLDGTGCLEGGKPIGVTLHCTQHPVREQRLSSQPSQKTQKIFHPDEAPYHASRIPSFDQCRHATHQNRKHHFRHAQHQKLSQHGIEDCFTVQMPKKERLFKIRRPLLSL